MRVFPIRFHFGHTQCLLLFVLDVDACCDRSDAHIVTLAPHDRYRMFEPNMDEYLDEEIDSLKQTFEQTCRDWEKKVLSILLHPRT